MHIRHVFGSVHHVKVYDQEHFLGFLSLTVEKPKPHFEMYFKIMLDLNSKPSETLVLEDSHVGRQAVLDAGCHLLPIIDTYDV